MVIGRGLVKWHRARRSHPVADITGAELDEEERAREEVAERQRRSRARRREEEEESLAAGLDGRPQQQLHVSRREVGRVSTRIANYINRELGSTGQAFRHQVMESVLTNKKVSPYLPDCYRSEADLKVGHAFLESYRKELKLLKNPCSKEKLARKKVLLEAAVGSDVSGVRALSKVLGANPRCVAAAVERRQSLQSTGMSIFKLAERKRRPGLSEALRELVIGWWIAETRVSPNKRDVRRRRIGKWEYETHATHLLLENQVSIPVNNSDNTV
jgi:hypothetical protein